MCTGLFPVRGHYIQIHYSMRADYLVGHLKVDRNVAQLKGLQKIDILAKL